MTRLPSLALTLVSLGVLATAVGCGSEEAESTPNAGGTAGSAGLNAGASGRGDPTGGTAGSAGAASGAAGTASGASGTSGSGGASGSGGSATASGGSSGSAGSSGGNVTASGGSNSAGSTTGGQGGGGAGGSGNEMPVTCAIDVSATRAEAISSVVVATFTTDLPSPTSASIEFGEDESYGLEAPVDLQAENYRTLLLGVPFQSEVHYRVKVRSATGVCVGEDQTITTGAPPAGVPTMTPQVEHEDEITPGFIVLGIDGGWATIYNHAGALVWAYKTSINGIMPRVDFTYDARFIIARDGNPSGQAGAGQILRISLDGATEEPIELDRSHHDFTATPDNGIVFFTGHTDNCGKLVKMDADGTFHDLFLVADAFDSLPTTGSDRCHMNSLHYHEFDDSISFSVLTQNAYVKISSQGELQWVLGGTGSDFTGDGSDWTRQHGHTMPDERHLLFFNNRSNGETALAVEVELDLDGKTAQRVFEYDGGGSSQTLGDVQRLPGGNTLVTYCNDGLQHEIDPEMQLVRAFEWSESVGYATHRPSLYGPPPSR